MKQMHSSKNTSVNTTRLPAVYNKINWKHYSHPIDNYSIIDIGCGKMETQRLIRKKLIKENIKNFYPWDPNHECIVDKSLSRYVMKNADINKVIICSCVLNVIDNNTVLDKLISKICDMSVVKLSDGTYRMNPVFISVYEGDKSGVGKETKKDCWQRNERLSAYLDKFNDYIKHKYHHNANFFTIKYGMIIGVIQYGGHLSYET